MPQPWAALEEAAVGVAAPRPLEAQAVAAVLVARLLAVAKLLAAAVRPQAAAAALVFSLAACLAVPRVLRQKRVAAVRPEPAGRYRDRWPSH